jgi:hypothetical protein
LPEARLITNADVKRWMDEDEQGIALLDVSVLVPLFCEDHVHHEASDWFADNAADLRIPPAAARGVARAALEVITPE